MGRTNSYHLRKSVFLFFLFVLILGFTKSGFADSGEVANSTSEENHLSEQERRSLAFSFVQKMKRGLAQADRKLAAAGVIKQETHILPDGELLLLQPVLLPSRSRLDGVVLSQSRNNKILVSLGDFASILQLPITVDLEGRSAKGWYIREENTFDLQIAEGYAETPAGRFSLSEDVIFEDGDIWVPIAELGQWMSFDMETKVSTQSLDIKSSQPLPIQQRLLRRNLDLSRHKIPEPKLPRSGEDYKLVSSPSIDVSTNSTYRRDGDDDKGVSRHTANIRTVNDLAYGTLTTQTQYDDVNQIRNVRATYKQESNDADLLGPLKARRFDVGDVLTVPTQLLGGTIRQELGGRVTNTDPLRAFSSPSTSISGNAFPGWDVELYRENQLIGFQEVEDNGFYNFENVILFNSDNNFRLVFYGPQGEVREETLSIPVDNSILAEQGGIYDVSVTLNDMQTYEKDLGGLDEDEGSPNIVAYYERPLFGRTTGSVGFRSSEHEGDRNNVGQVGVSTTFGQTLLNADVAVDDEGETAAELVARRSFQDHDIVNRLSWIGENFDTEANGDNNDVGTFRENFRVVGKLPFEIGNRPRYNLNLNYTQNTEGDSTFSSTAGFNTGYKRFTINEALTYTANDLAPDDTASSLTSVTGVFGKNRLRMLADYNILPDSQLSRVLATYQRDFTRKLDLTLDVERRVQQSLTELTARLDWQAGFVRISPRVSYNSENDLFAGFSTRFGVLRDPSTGGVHSFDRTITSNGTVSTFVFLDENGDGQYNEGEEKLKDVVVHALQNGGREKTDENGIAVFTRMQRLKLTDVMIEKSSLQDPTWIPGFEGASILPREGYTAQLDFPVHISGEMDGVLYANVNYTDDDLQESVRTPPLRNVELSLYDEKGQEAMRTTTDSGGFYYFAQIPPGRYLLTIDPASAERNKFVRPMPQPVEIKYDGTIIYGNNIYVDMGSDVPSEIKADIEDYKARHPHVDFKEQEYDLVLNLGEYNSRLLMSVVWYKLRARFGGLFDDADVFVPPTESFADTETGKHTLRVGLKGETLEGAYGICRSLIARDRTCKVEIFPSYMGHLSAGGDNKIEQAKADRIAKNI